MKILLVNDDGIQAPGLFELAKLARTLGDVTVVAPKHQCSGMSQKLTLSGEMELTPEPDFPVAGVTAWSLDGTPTDCVKVGLDFCCDTVPDIIFSGINNGTNLGYDTAYSGTLGGAFEAVQNGIPAIAFSVEYNTPFDGVEAYFTQLMERALPLTGQKNVILNINFPACSAGEIKSIAWDVPLSGMQMYRDGLAKSTRDGKIFIEVEGVRIADSEAQPGTDIDAVIAHCISVSVISPVAEPFRPLRKSSVI